MTLLQLPGHQDGSHIPMSRRGAEIKVLLLLAVLAGLAAVSLIHAWRRWRQRRQDRARSLKARKWGRARKRGQ